MISDLTRDELAVYYSSYDLKRLELYSQNLVDYHLVMDLLPTLAKLYYLGQIQVSLSAVQSVCVLIRTAAHHGQLPLFLAMIILEA